MSGKRRIGVQEFKGTRMINIREYYEKEGEMLPGKKVCALGFHSCLSMWMLVMLREFYFADGEFVSSDRVSRFLSSNSTLSSVCYRRLRAPSRKKGRRLVDRIIVGWGLRPEMRWRMRMEMESQRPRSRRISRRRVMRSECPLESELSCWIVASGYHTYDGAQRSS